MVESKIKSILAVDCGNTITTVALIEHTEGKYRLSATGQAPSTHQPPWQDIAKGVQAATRHIEKETGRVLLASGEWPITPCNAGGQGVDAFVVVVSAGPPLSMALAGLIQQLSLAGARRAAATTYSVVTTELSLDKESDSGKRSVEAQIQAVQVIPPEVILLVGGTDGGAERPVVEMSNVILMALQILKHTDRPQVLFAGNVDTRDQVAQILAAETNLRVVDNLRPTLETENLVAVQAELENLYVQQKMSRLPGFDKLHNWSAFPPAPASKSFANVIDYLGQHNKLNVMGVNVGSGATMVSTRAQETHGVIVRSDAGIGHSLAKLIEAVPLEKFQRWLPFDLELDELHNLLLNKCLYPTRIPDTFEALMVEYAIARESIRLTVEQARAGWPLQPSTGRHDIAWNLLIGGGSVLTKAPHPAHAAMLLLDAVEPWGLTTLALDANNLLNMLGVIAAINPVAAVEVANRSAVTNLATVVAPAGHGYAGKTALNLKITYADDNGLELEVPYGTIQRLDLPPGQKAALEMRPTRYFDIGLGQPGRGAIAEIEGSALGLIIDARGRPLRLPQDDARRQDQLIAWAEALTRSDHTLVHKDK